LNQFTGGVPTSVSNIPTLKELYLHANSFTGSLDAEFCTAQATVLEEFEADCLGETPDTFDLGEVPEVICTCCTLCCMGDGESLECSVPPPLPTEPPAGPNITEAEADLRFSNLVDLLTPISSADIFQDTSSPQYVAANWIAREDHLILDISADNLDAVVERYVLALTYHSTNGPSWTDQDGYLSEFGLCDWHGVSCDGIFITSLNLARNNLDGTIPTEIRFLASVEELKMGKNALKGNVPSEIGDFPYLRELDLSENMLNGSIPSEIGLLTFITKIEMHINALTGSIPTEIGLLTLLEGIDLEENQLTGPIPSEIGKVLTLEWIAFTRNSLNGQIPVEIALISSLEDLLLGSNGFTGQIPVQIGQMTSLRELGICKYM
jgi:Leucine-rich repeat (LRR) protein